MCLNTDYLLITCTNSEVSSDGKSLINPASTKRSTAYGEFVEPITNGDRGGFDIHIYFMQSDEFETKYAKELHERIRRECMIVEARDMLAEC